MRKFIAFLIIFSICLPCVSPNKKEKNEIDFVIDELKSIREGGFTEEEIEVFIEILQEKFGEDSIYVNTMCKVVGIGGGIIFPPFIPLTPALIAFPITFLDTQGLQGHWAHAVHVAIFIPFVGFSMYVMLPAIFAIAGFSGVVIGIVFD